MPTKSGRIKLEDIRQGKTIWVPMKPVVNDLYAGLDGTRPVFTPHAFMVVEGARLRVAGLRQSFVDSLMDSYSLPVFMLDGPHYWDKYSLKADRRVTANFFHPDRNKDIHTLPDGSFYHANAFTTRRRCQRQCDQLNRERLYEILESLRFQATFERLQSIGHAKYPVEFTDATAPWPGDDVAPDGQLPEDPSGLQGRIPGHD